MKTLFLIGLLASSLTAQTSPVPTLTPAGTPTLSKTEQLAISQVISEIVKAREDSDGVEADLQKAHPGYGYNFYTGQFYKLTPSVQPNKPAASQNKK